MIGRIYNKVLVPVWSLPRLWKSCPDFEKLHRICPLWPNLLKHWKSLVSKRGGREYFRTPSEKIFHNKILFEISTDAELFTHESNRNNSNCIVKPLPQRRGENIFEPSRKKFFILKFYLKSPLTQNFLLMSPIGIIPTALESPCLKGGGKIF